MEAAVRLGQNLTTMEAWCVQPSLLKQMAEANFEMESHHIHMGIGNHNAKSFCSQKLRVCDSSRSNLGHVWRDFGIIKITCHI